MLLQSLRTAIKFRLINNYKFDIIINVSYSFISTEYTTKFLSVYLCLLNDWSNWSRLWLLSEILLCPTFYCKILKLLSDDEAEFISICLLCITFCALLLCITICAHSHNLNLIFGLWWKLIRIYNLSLEFCYIKANSALFGLDNHAWPCNT